VNKTQIRSISYSPTEEEKEQYKWVEDLTKPISLTTEIKDKKTIKHIHDLVEKIKWQQAIWKYYYFNIKRW